MALFIDTSDRLIIPSWRKFGNTINELNPIGQYKHPVGQGDIWGYVKRWRDFPNLISAGELISAAIVNDRTTEAEVSEAAGFILQSSDSIPRSLNNASKRLHNISLSPEEIPQREFPIYGEIAKLKELLSRYPTSAILHIEIARCYVLLGQIKSASLHIDSALYFDRHNRFVVRAAARFLIHIKEEEKAVQTLRNSGLTKRDPWLMASEISVSRRFKKRSPNVKRAIQLIESGNFSDFDLSELRGTIGMEEYVSASYKKSRKLFNQSLLSPNDNSFAQAQWMMQNRHMELLFPSTPIDVTYKESLCHEKFFEGDYAAALQYAKEWQVDAPYSIKCAMFGSGISTIYQKDYKTSILILNTYLRTNNKSKEALNDLAYAYVLNNETAEAQRRLDSVARFIDMAHLEEVDICLVATQGLICFRTGNIDEGSRLYEKAIELSRPLPRKEYFYSAILNYCRELMRSSNEASAKEKVQNMLAEVADYPKGTPIQLLKEEVDEMLENIE